MNLILEPYQEEAVEWIVSRERSALFTSVGLGKTATVLEAFKRLLGQNKVQHMLVVAPLRVARWTWPMEIAKWDNFSWMKTCQLRTNIHSAHVYLINYESLHKVPTKRFDMVVFDELTKLKNPKGKRFKAFMPLLQHIPYRVGLTGTPAANSLEDLFGQVLALDDGQRLGRSFYQFRQRWFRQVDYMGYKWEPKADAEQNLRDKLKGLALVQSSEDFSDVADADVIDIDVPLTGEVADRYRELQKEMLLELGDQVVTAVNAAILVNKLLQYTGGHVYDEEGVAAHVHGEKLKALAKLVDPASPLLVGVNYRSERDAIAEVIPGAEVWDEDTTLDRWNAGEIPVLVAHPASIGHGLNLQAGGHRVCWYSLPWSRENYIQFNARVARKGQRRKPVIYRLLCPGTVDDVVAETLRSREKSENSLLTAVRLLQNQTK